MDVVTSKGIDWQREKWQSGLGSKFIHQGEKNVAKYADEVIVLSKGVQDYFKETYGRETHFINNISHTLNIENTVVEAKDASSRAKKIVQKGDVIFATIRPYLKNICILKEVVPFIKDWGALIIAGISLLVAIISLFKSSKAQRLQNKVNELELKIKQNELDKIAKEKEDGCSLPPRKKQLREYSNGIYGFDFYDFTFCPCCGSLMPYLMQAATSAPTT